MPATLNVNFLTVVHASSSGIAMSFPDVCKTPSPAGPIPIPYPNVAQSSDTADGSSTVKVDGNPVMLKSSNLKMSTGDEAGSAQGVVSNKIKGKALPINASFDVKFDGEPVFRLTDPMQSNSGSPSNAMNPALVQPPQVLIPSMSQPCQDTNEKKEEQEKTSTSWGQCGILDEHRPKIQQVTDRLNMVVYFRQTKKVCGHWIRLKHMPKPHSCLSGTTITPDAAPKVQKWLNSHFAKMSEKERALQPPMALPELTNKFYYSVAEKYIGIIGNPASGGIQPLKGGGKQAGAYYGGKWMTGDYDLFEVLSGVGKCQKVSGPNFALLKKSINKSLQWDAIQHGPQAQWAANAPKDPHEQKQDFDMNVEVNNVVAGKPGARKTVQIDPNRKPMKVIDSPLTVVCGANVITLKDEKAVIDSLKCKACGED